MPAAEAPAKPKPETWRDWAGPYAPEPDPLLSRDEVLERLQQIRVDATERDLRFWEAKGVLPRPVRQMHHGAVRAVYPWWYPHLVWEVRRLQHLGHSLPEIAQRARTIARTEEWVATDEVDEDIHSHGLGRVEGVADLRLSPALMVELERLARWYERVEGLPVVEVTIAVRDEHGNEHEFLRVPVATQKVE